MSSDIASKLRAMLAEVESGNSTHCVTTNKRVDDVTNQYRREYLTPRYKREKPGHYYRMNRVCTWIDDEFCDVPVTEFGPKKLRHLRKLFMKAGGCRWYVNLQVRDVIRVFRLGVEEELVPAWVLVGLQAVKPLQPGEHPDNEQREKVSLFQVQATVQHLPPMVADMVRLQLRLGCRPIELFRLTPSMVDRSRPDVWSIRPPKHKTAHHGVKKSMPLVDDAKDIISRYLLRGPADHCFTNRLGRPWNRNSYRDAISKAAKKAGVALWNPYAIRALSARVVRQERGLEAAQALLGHTSSKITEEYYAELTEREAIEAARVAPKVG